MTVSIAVQHRLSDAVAINVSIETPHRCIGLTGPSGSGKTTLLHIIAGLIPADHSRIAIGAQRLDHRPPEHRRVGLAMQRPHLFPHLSVERNLLFGAGSSPSTTAVHACIEWLEIGALMGRSIRHLSGGERQRVAIGRAVLANPKLLLLDEPFAAVDSDRAQRIAANLRAHVDAAGIAMIAVSHQRQTLDALGDQTVVLPAMG